MKSFIPVVISIMCFNFCAQSQTYIDLKSKLSKDFDRVVYSDIFTEIQYIPLETLPTNLIGSKFNISIVDNFILVTDINSQYLFDSKNGKFITQIGRQGKGPGEYQSVIGLVDNKQKRVYSKGWKADLIAYDFNGKYLGNIKIPGYENNFISPSFPTNYSRFEDNFVCYFTNCIGTETKLITFFNDNGKVIRTMKNYNQVAKQNYAFTNIESVFYHYNNKLYFNEIYNDTVFELAPDYKKPQYIIDAGKYRSGYLSKWEKSPDEGQNYFYYSKIMESKNYLFLPCYLKDKQGLCVFDKKMKKLLITNELQNDIDHFYNLSPLSILNDNQLVGVIDAYKAVEWFKNYKNTLSPNIKRLSTIKESDNPIIVIAKLK